MSQISGNATIWDLPNYTGMLFTADEENTPILSMMGGINGGEMIGNFEFPTSSEYDYPSAAQPAITETASLTAPSATEFVRDQVKNVTQIFMQAVNLSYEKLANRARLSGINTVGGVNNVQDELDAQIAYNLKIIARNIEYTILNGAYQIATSAAVANKTRGLMACCDETGSVDINASSADFSKSLFEQMIQGMFEAGAPLVKPTIICGAYQRQQISDVYGFVPTDRYVGGLSIDQIITPLGSFDVMPAHRFMTTSAILCADLGVISAKFQDVPGKGSFFYETLAKTGAAESGQIFGKFGLDHGAYAAHGKIYGLATS